MLIRTQCGFLNFFTLIFLRTAKSYKMSNQAEDAFGMILLIWTSMLKLVSDVLLLFLSYA